MEGEEKVVVVIERTGNSESARRNDGVPWSDEKHYVNLWPSYHSTILRYVAVSCFRNSISGTSVNSS